MLILLVNTKLQIQKKLENNPLFFGDDIFSIQSGKQAISILQSFKVDLIVMGDDSWKDEVKDVLACIDDLKSKPLFYLFAQENILNVYKQLDLKAISKFYLSPVDSKKLLVDIQSMKRGVAGEEI